MWPKSQPAFISGAPAAWIGAVLLAGSVSVSAQPGADLPPAPGVDVVRTACLVCHEADLIRQQRLTRDGWQRELDKMVRWGATVKTDADRALVLTYLTGLGGRPPESGSPVAAGPRGADVFQARCLACHQADLARQQRLTVAGWTREVEKMTRWGAGVKDDEKEPLVSYLRSGPDIP